MNPSPYYKPWPLILRMMRLAADLLAPAKSWEGYPTEGLQAQVPAQEGSP
jgi:hypothetical protein